tara:strand:+ start:535 stop:1095 length:561 start_codon:yes stop_codon:yes gene_type:complete
MKIKDKDHYGLYFGDPRYEKVWEQMKLLGIQDITTMRQHKNGTIVWKLPIKDQDSGILIEVASFASGYVRNQGKSTHTNFQLNKRCEGEPEYFELPNGDYRRFSTRSCVLIPIEIDRLEYLISYCLKNYYIKNANTVPNGDYVPKWKLDNAINACNKMEQRADDFENNCALQNLSVTVNGERYKII